MDQAERAARFRMARGELNRHGPQTLMQVVEATGIALSTIHAFENEKSSRTPGGQTATKLADYYGVNVAWLSGQSDNPLLTEDLSAAISQTGLSYLAIRNIQEMTADPEWKDCLNALFESEDFKKLISFLAASRQLSDSHEQDEGGVDYSHLRMRENQSGTGYPVLTESDVRSALIWKSAAMLENTVKKKR